jgi:hypothetical protein
MEKGSDRAGSWGGRWRVAAHRGVEGWLVACGSRVFLLLLYEVEG